MAKTNSSGTTKVSAKSKSGRLSYSKTTDQRSRYAYKLAKRKLKGKHAENMLEKRHQIRMIQARGSAGAKTIAAYKGGQALEKSQDKYSSKNVPSVNTFQEATLNNKELDLRRDENDYPDEERYASGGYGMY